MNLILPIYLTENNIVDGMGRLTKELTFSTCGVAQIIVEAETAEAKQIWTANPTNANGAADAQREFNGTDLFGSPSVVLSLFLSGSIYGGAKSKERNRTTAKSEERRAPWPKTEREVQRGRPTPR